MALLIWRQRLVSRCRKITIPNMAEGSDLKCWGLGDNWQLGVKV